MNNLMENFKILISVLIIFGFGWASGYYFQEKYGNSVYVVNIKIKGEDKIPGVRYFGKPGPYRICAIFKTDEYPIACECDLLKVDQELDPM